MSNDVNQVLGAVERYNYELWNERRFDLADEIIGEEMIRNSPGSREVLSRDLAVARIRSLWQGYDRMAFTLRHTVTQGDLCTIIYQADLRKHDGTEHAIASIEVFRVANGRIVEVWNNTHDPGWWPEAEGGPGR